MKTTGPSRKWLAVLVVCLAAVFGNNAIVAVLRPFVDVANTVMPTS